MKYHLLKCKPTQYGSANISIAETETKNKQDAILEFQKIKPLNQNGYYKNGATTYVIAEQYQA